MKTITYDDFDLNGDDIKLNKEGPAIVLLYKEWCPYCRQVKPILQKYSEKGGVVYLMDGEIGNNGEIFEKLGVTTVPDIRLLQEDKTLGKKHDDDRTVESFEKFLPIKKQTGGKRKRNMKRKKNIRNNRNKSIKNKKRKTRKTRKVRKMSNRSK
jgi:thiol-disulfide isomerase/thioredoxin